MSKSIQGNTQWQTARIINKEDVVLGEYIPSEAAAAADVGQMIAVHPATAIILRAFGKDTDGYDATVIITGWMDIVGKVNGPGPGHRLWKGVLTLGSHAASYIPNGDGKWGAAATWFEVDTWTPTYDTVGVSVLDSALSGSVANQESVIILPTLGYTRIQIEVDDLKDTGEMTEIGFLWRPAVVGEVVRSI